MLFADRYDTGPLLGGGGYGQVYRAFDRHLHRDVALKLLTRGDPLTFATREAIALAALEGPFILRVLNADKYQDVPYIATEIAVGGSTDDRIGTHGVRVDLAVHWTRHALEGLTVCHTRGLLHRDIKPANIFLQSDDHALLGDFGVAATLDPQGRAPAAGTIFYRPPESWTAGVQTMKSDIYSTGLALYRLLTGYVPFDRASEQEVRDAILAQDLPRVRDLAPHIPRTVQQRVEKAISADPADRFVTANEFHEALGSLPVWDKTWVRIAPHTGHDRCWNGGPSPAQPSIRVCVTASGGAFSIETRRIAGSQARILEACGVASNEHRLGVFLRRVFDNL